MITTTLTRPMYILKRKFYSKVPYIFVEDGSPSTSTLGQFRLLVACYIRFGIIHMVKLCECYVVLVRTYADPLKSARGWGNLALTRVPNAEIWLCCIREIARSIRVAKIVAVRILRTPGEARTLNLPVRSRTPCPIWPRGRVCG